MIAALLLALAPQDPYDVHLRNVHLERRQAFLGAWEAAAEPRRELVREAFRARRSQGVPAVYQVSAQHLTEYTRVLEGAVDAAHELSWEQRFACSLDLHVLPGAFTAGASGRGDEVIVRVLPAMSRLFEPLPDGPKQGCHVNRERFGAMLDEYYMLMGWDLETGNPTPGKLLELGLQWTLGVLAD